MIKHVNHVLQVHLHAVRSRSWRSTHTTDHRHLSRAFMTVEKGEIEEDCMVAVIDTGCNLICHGSQWMEEYLRATGMDIPLEPSNGKFNGVGGKIKVKGLRTIPVTFDL